MKVHGRPLNNPPVGFKARCRSCHRCGGTRSRNRVEPLLTCAAPRPPRQALQRAERVCRGPCALAARRSSLRQPSRAACGPFQQAAPSAREDAAYAFAPQSSEGRVGFRAGPCGRAGAGAVGVPKGAPRSAVPCDSLRWHGGAFTGKCGGATHGRTAGPAQISNEKSHLEKQVRGYRLTFQKHACTCAQHNTL